MYGAGSWLHLASSLSGPGQQASWSAVARAGEPSWQLASSTTGAVRESASLQTLGERQMEGTEHLHAGHGGALPAGPRPETPAAPEQPSRVIGIRCGDMDATFDTGTWLVTHDGAFAQGCCTLGQLPKLH